MGAGGRPNSAVVRRPTRGMRAIAIVIACLIFAAPLAAQEAQVAGDETSAVVEPAANEAVARPLAEKYCAQYDRFASFRCMEGPRAHFECTVEKREPRKFAFVFCGRGNF